jgi:prohibitin 2
MEAPLVSIYDKPPRSRAQLAWWRFVEQHLPVLVIYLLVATLIAVVLAPFTLVTVPSGYVGVLWKRFGGGTVLDPRKLKAEGMRITLPWNTVFLYDLRLQSATETYNAISRDGISLTATINIRFRLKREAVPQLHQSVGPDYIQSLIEPEIGNRMREVFAEYTAEDVYSTKRAEVQDKIRQRAEAMMGEKMMSGGGGEEGEENAPYRISLSALLNLIDTLILGIELPKAVETAINRKIEQYYISEEYKFRVAREIRESERKKIEAEGISEFQRIVTQGISDSYLRWRGIEATLQLAQSSNSKIVIMGGKDGLPIILGNVDASPSPQPASSPAGNGDAAPKERTTAATPSPPSEKTPSDTLSKPVEKTPAPSTQPPEAQRLYSFPTSLSDIEAAFSRITGAMRPPETVPPDSNSPKKPAQQH